MKKFTFKIEFTEICDTKEHAQDLVMDTISTGIKYNEIDSWLVFVSEEELTNNPEKDVDTAEKELFDKICEVSAFLNMNGIPFDRISEMIEITKKNALKKIEKTLREKNESAD